MPRDLFSPCALTPEHLQLKSWHLSTCTAASATALAVSTLPAAASQRNMLPLLAAILRSYVLHMSRGHKHHLTQILWSSAGGAGFSVPEQQ